MTCVVLEPSVTRTLQQSSTLYTPPASWGQSLLSLYILHSTYLVSCVLYLNQTWTWTRTSHVQKYLSKLQYFAADGKKCLRMLWKWLDRTEVNLIMCRWLFCGNIVDDLKTCWNSALTILIHLYLIKLFSQQDLWPDWGPPVTTVTSLSVCRRNCISTILETCTLTGDWKARPQCWSDDRITTPPSVSRSSLAETERYHTSSGTHDR